MPILIGDLLADAEPLLPEELPLEELPQAARAPRLATAIRASSARTAGAGQQGPFVN
jgi:hypothetical protein